MKDLLAQQKFLNEKFIKEEDPPAQGGGEEEKPPEPQKLKIDIPETPFEVDIQQVKDELKKILNQWKIKNYMSDHPTFAVERTTDFRINRYGVGGFMGNHADLIHRSHGQTYGFPQVSALLYLNDDYDGGEFIVAGKKFEPEKGSAIIFPSNFMFPHSVNQITSGTRYALIGWVI